MVGVVEDQLGAPVLGVGTAVSTKVRTENPKSDRRQWFWRKKGLLYMVRRAACGDFRQGEKTYVCVEQDILALQVTVNDSSIMQRRHSLGHLGEVPPRLVVRERL